VDDLVTVAIELVAKHPAVTRVEFGGSRSRGAHEELSDWDFAVETSDFGAIARDLPSLVSPMDPLAEQWEPLGHFPVYQVMLRGPTKVEYLFLEQSQDPMAPVNPSRETLVAINTHFWDWIWWLATKASVGRSDLVAEHLPQLHRHLLGPLGVATVRRYTLRGTEVDSPLVLNPPDGTAFTRQPPPEAEPASRHAESQRCLCSARPP
jgi:hypothetical protein